KVTPGDITVARGSDVTIQAVAMGFDPQRAEVHLRYANGTQWEIVTMEVAPQNVPTFRHLVFNLQESVHYFVAARGNRSREFTIELTNTNRSKYLGLEEYSMEALDDQKPIVEFTKPGRDTKATKVEEVFTELRAEDDFGVRQLELYYSVNGGAEQKVDLFASK